MTRYRITADQQPDGYPPFVLDGVGVDTLECDEGDVNAMLEEAAELRLTGISCTPIGDGAA